MDGDEHPRHGTTMEKLQRLKPAFKNPGTVTAGNASGINDGAAAVMLMTYSTTKEQNLAEPMARVVAWAQAGVDPKIMGTGPIPAIREVVREMNRNIKISRSKDILVRYLVFSILGNVSVVSILSVFVM